MRRRDSFLIILALLICTVETTGVYAAQSADATYTATFATPVPPGPTPTPGPGAAIGITAGGIAGAFSFFPTLSRLRPSIASRQYPCPIYANPFFNNMYGEGTQIAQAVPVRVAVTNDNPKYKVTPDSLQGVLAGGAKQPNVIMYDLKIKGPGAPNPLSVEDPKLVKTSFDEKSDKPGKYVAEVTYTYAPKL